VKNAICIYGVKEVTKNVQEENGVDRHEVVGGVSKGSECNAK